MPTRSYRKESLDLNQAAEFLLIFFAIIQIIQTKPLPKNISGDQKSKNICISFPFFQDSQKTSTGPYPIWPAN